MTVAVLTDSAASLPLDRARQLGIRSVPMTLVLGGIVYTDGELDPTEMMLRATTESMTTAAPSPGDFAKAIEEAEEGDGALVVTVNSAMSASFAAARLAAADFGVGTVETLDSGTAAGAQGLVALAAAEVATRGADLAEVVAVARRVATRVRLLAGLESLDRLARSGRVPNTAAWAGRSLGMRAVFEFSEGRVRPRRPALGLNAALGRMLDAVARSQRVPSTLRAAIMHAQAPAEAHLLGAQIEAIFPGADIFRAPFSAVLVAHTGPGLVGVAWWWDGPDDGDGLEAA